MSRVKYAIRESDRAKHVRLRISVFDASLTVVIPKGFDRDSIPEVIEEKQSWIARTRMRIAQEREQTEAHPPAALPDHIHLRALDQDWQIEYAPEARSSILVTERRGDRALALAGPVDDAELCKHALCAWIGRKARAELVPWLRSVSEEHGLPVSAIQVRGQRTRWGSCSQHSAISINAKLIFLPPHLVEHVFVHELCHTIHLDHSRRYWAQVRKRVPHYQDLEAELRTAWRYVPVWLNGHGRTS